MSEDGCFVTEDISCERCYEAVYKALSQWQDKYLFACTLPSYNPDRPDIYRIIAGRIKGAICYTYDIEFTEMLESLICHPVKFAVIAEGGGDKVFTIKPKK